MMKNAYIIESGKRVIAMIPHCDHPKGTTVRWSHKRVEESVDANRHWNLVNARESRISFAKKWSSLWLVQGDEAKIAIEISPKEYYLR